MYSRVTRVRIPPELTHRFADALRDERAARAALARSLERQLEAIALMRDGGASWWEVARAVAAELGEERSTSRLSILRERLRKRFRRAVLGTTRPGIQRVAGGLSTRTGGRSLSKEESMMKRVRRVTEEEWIEHESPLGDLDPDDQPEDEADEDDLDDEDDADTNE